MRKEKIKKQNSRIMSKVKRKTSGITLIALVVTIVVLLILAAVSISMLGGENGIVTQAIKAKDETDIADEKERVQLAAVAAAGIDKWGEITEENLAEELTKNIGTRDEDYTLSKEGESFLVTYTDSNRSYLVDANGNITEAVKREGLKVGDYINYIPDENTTGYTTDKLTEAITGATQNASTITQDQQYAKDGTGMTWQILRIYADGSIDLIGSETNQSVYFKGANGYNNGVLLLNNACKAMYSNSSLGATGRSLKIEDIESVSSYGGATNQEYTPYYKSYPNIFAQEEGGAPNGTYGSLGRSEQSSYVTGNSSGNSSFKGKWTYYNYTMSSSYMNQKYVTLFNCSPTSWLASRCVEYGNTRFYFSMFCVDGGRVNPDWLFGSDYGTYSNSYAVRPVVEMRQKKVDFLF